jgi:hypothetical protein
VTSDAENIQTIQIFNTLGVLVFLEKAISTRSMLLDISHLETSIYYLQINLMSHTELKKIIVN